MANRSSIKANEEELKAYFADLAAQNLSLRAHGPQSDIASLV
jgi:hypothetical protein